MNYSCALIAFFYYLLLAEWNQNFEMFYFILIILESCNGKISLPDDSYKQIAKAILHQFPGYQVMFHFDSITYSKLDKYFIADSNFFQTTLLVNYDDTWKVIQRPVGYKYVHMVHLHDPFHFERYSDGMFNLEYCDAVIFIINRLVLKHKFKSLYDYKIWNQTGIDRAGSVIIYDHNQFSFHFVKYYVGNLSGVLQGTNKTKTVPKLLEYMNDFNDFNGYLFKIGFNQFPPYVWCRFSINSNDCEVLHGIEGNFLNVLSNHLNFRFKMINYKGMEPSPWPAMISSVHYQKLDWAIGAISTTMERITQVDFGASMKIEGYSILYSSSINEFKKWNDVLRPFKLSLWILFTCVILLYSYIFQKARTLVLQSKCSFYYKDFLLMTYRPIVEQSEPLHLQSHVLRILFSTWCLAAIILVTVYKTNLASNMIQPKVSEPNSVSELLEKHYNFRVDNEDWSVLRNNLIESKDKMFETILSLCSDKYTYCDSIASLFGNNLAMIDEGTPLQQQALVTCKNVSNFKDYSTLRLTRQQIFATVYAWPFQLGSPYRTRFSRLIQNFHATGHLNEWYKSAFKTEIPKSNQQNLNYRATALKMRTFLAPGLMLLVGYTLSTFVLIYEITVFKYFT